MLCIVSDKTHAPFNLAAEEYLFRNFEQNIFFLYRNNPSVVVGKHQNALAEVNPRFVFGNQIPVIRRLSGGGAVYHDPGNLNFSFHETVADTSKISFKKFNEPIVALLNNLGVEAYTSQRNDIFVNEYKVSGHAEHVFRNRILSHGTLLYDANKENLSAALKNISGKFTGKAIQSVRSRVANISEFMHGLVSIEEFENQLLQHILMLDSKNVVYKLSESDIIEIQNLMATKYEKWEWNMGYSPNYRFDKQQGAHSLSLWVEKGIMKEIAIESSVLSSSAIESLIQTLTGKAHRIEVLEETITSLLPHAEDARELVDIFF